jgi:hypothetical protein
MATFIPPPIGSALSSDERMGVSTVKVLIGTTQSSNEEDPSKTATRILQLMSRASKRSGRPTGGAKSDSIQEMLHVHNYLKQSCRDLRDTERMSETNASIASPWITEWQAAKTRVNVGNAHNGDTRHTTSPPGETKLRRQSSTSFIDLLIPQLHNPLLQVGNA